uniref:(northern house mosquito) hypothetical protein n=1 Tax=Culex pipiens TaxID=7175 RepID=A0A8D8E2K5_CULPI
MLGNHRRTLVEGLGHAKRFVLPGPGLHTILRAGWIAPFQFGWAGQRSLSSRTFLHGLQMECTVCTATWNLTTNRERADFQLTVQHVALAGTWFGHSHGSSWLEADHSSWSASG